MGRYLDLARRVLESSPGTLTYEINEKTKKDPYRELAETYLAKICRPDYPAGMVPWLGDNHSTLYDELTCNLPDEIHKLWVDQAPLSEFDRILGIWLEAHRTACDLYSKAVK